MNKQKKGFTLIELLVVIAIIGILATLAVVALQQARKNARDAKRIADVRQIQTALELYFNDHQSYPGTEDLENAILNGGPLASLNPGTSAVYMNIWPSAPTPVDGSSCSLFFDETNGGHYSYYSFGDDEYDPECHSNSGGETCHSYALFFCLGGKTGGLDAGPKVMTPGGVLEYNDFFDDLINRGGYSYDDHPFPFDHFSEGGQVL